MIYKKKHQIVDGSVLIDIETTNQKLFFNRNKMVAKNKLQSDDYYYFQLKYNGPMKFQLISKHKNKNKTLLRMKQKLHNC